MIVEPVTLEGKSVRLEPLRVDHLPALCRVGLDEAIWRWTANIVKDESDIERYVREALADQAVGKAVPFVTIEAATGTVVGSTRFGNIDPVNRKAEIGWTWINPQWQRTAINTEAKLLMLTHAFDALRCRRVELKTSTRNARSRAAMLRIGATEEGTLRQHMINPDGSSRDSVYFSILDGEWPMVKERLAGMLSR